MPNDVDPATLAICHYVLAPLSVIAGLVLIGLFAYYPYLRKPPGWLIIWQCIAQTVLDLHWFSFSLRQEDPLCDTTAIVGVYCYFLAYMYTGLISWVIVQCLRHPVDVADYKTTKYWQHAMCHVGAMVFTIPMASAKGCGRSTMGTCFTNSGSWAEVMPMVPLVVFTPLMLTAVWFSYRKYDMRYRTFITRHVAVVSVFALCWLPVALIHFLNLDGIQKHPLALQYIAALLGSASGLLTVTARLLEPGLVKKLVTRKSVSVEIAKDYLSLAPDVEWTL